MAWPAREDLRDGQLDAARQDVARLAQAIARFEPVHMLVEPEQQVGASQLCGPSVSLLSMPVDDMWFRDSGPVFLSNGRGAIAGVLFNFNAWGNKQTHAKDRK
jgi:agmatine deiminase